MQSDPLASYGVDLRIAIAKGSGLVRSIAPLAYGPMLGLLVQVLTGNYAAAAATAVTVSFVGLVADTLERKALALAWARFAAEYPEEARLAREAVEDMRKDKRFWRSLDG